MARRRLGSRRLCLYWARYRWQQLAVVGMMAAIAMAGVVAPLTVQASARSAIEQSVRADQADFGYVVQATTTRARSRAAEIPSLVPLRDGQGLIDADGAVAQVALRQVVGERLPLGVLTAGRHAGLGEMTLAARQADSLGVQIGDDLAVQGRGRGSRTATVVGLTADPADRGDQTAILPVRRIRPADVTQWLSREEPYSRFRELRDGFDSQELQFRPTSSLVEAANVNMPSAANGLQKVAFGIAFLGLALIVATCMAMSRPARADVRTLMAAGMPARSAWRLLSILAFGSVGLGATLGFVGVSGIVWLCRSPVSAWLGQDWQGVTVQWLAPLLVLVGLSALVRPAAGIGRWAIIRARRWIPAHRGRHWPIHAAWLALGVGTAVLAVAWYARTRTPPSVLIEVAPLGAMLVAGALPILLVAPLSARLPPATRSVVRYQARALCPVVAVVAVCVVALGVRVAGETHDSHAFEALESPVQPPGSLLLYQVPRRAAMEIATEYQARGGESLVSYVLPDEHRHHVRVTWPRLVACLERSGGSDPDSLPQSCFPQRAMSPINLVALTEDPDASVTADVDLVREGEVGALDYDTASGLVAESRLIPATGAAELGGNMPGLVVPEGSDAARSLDLRGTDGRLLALLDFDSLEPLDQARMRGAIQRTAPAAQLTDATQTAGYELDRAVARAVAVAGAGVVGLVLLVGGLAVLTGTRRIRRTLAAIGASTRGRFRWATWWLSGAAVSVVSTTCLTWLAVRLSVINAPGDWGLAWLLPSLAAGLACIVLLLVASRLPSGTMRD